MHFEGERPSAPQLLGSRNAEEMLAPAIDACEDVVGEDKPVKMTSSSPSVCLPFVYAAQRCAEELVSAEVSD